MFRIVPEIEAWAEVTPTGAVRPSHNLGGLVTDSFLEVKQLVHDMRIEMDQRLNAERSAREKAVKMLQEQDMIVASRVALIENVLKERNILKKNKETLSHSQTIIDSCVICWNRHRRYKLESCGHVPVCLECLKILMDRDQRCPLCRCIISGSSLTYI